jgi:RNA polymerase sigma-70 factor, ECF subfamily
VSLNPAILRSVGFIVPREGTEVDALVSSRERAAAMTSLDVESDKALVERAIDGDLAAAQALFSRYAAEVSSLSLHILRHRADAGDAAQEALVTAFDRLGQLREPAEFRRWLRSIAMNECRRARRAAWWRRVLRGSDGDALRLEEMIAPAASPEQRALLRDVDRALDGLPQAHRDAWTLHTLEGITLPETASLCGCSLATVKRWIAAVEDRLAELRR